MATKVLIWLFSDYKKGPNTQSICTTQIRGRIFMRVEYKGIFSISLLIPVKPLLLS